MLDYRSGMPIFLAEDILICKFLLLHNLEAKWLQGKSTTNLKKLRDFQPNVSLSEGNPKDFLNANYKLLSFTSTSMFGSVFRIKIIGIGHTLETSQEFKILVQIP